MTRNDAQKTVSQLHKIDIEHVMPGADIICAGDEKLALGFPEEVVKSWMLAGASPTAWLVPDVRTAAGVVQWALEFPLYYALFIQGLFAKGEKIRVLCHERDWPDIVDYLRLTLLGLTADELARADVAPAIAQMLLAEGDHLALKHKDGRIAQIEDFLAPCFFDAEGLFDLGELRVRSHGDNTYSFFTADDRVEEYRLEVACDGIGQGREQLPPYATPLSPGSTPILPQPFEVVTLGATNGFDVQGPCSNMLVQANGRFLLIDCGPYIRTLLNHCGVCLNQLNALVITHVHEDHAVGLAALLELTHRIKLYISKENAAILRTKLAILHPNVQSPASLLDDAFEIVYVEPGRAYDFLGLKLRFHYTMHSIPCTGVELSMRQDGTTRKVLIVGDNNSRENIQAAAAAGAMTESRLAELEALYQWEGDLLIADAGAGLIHGMPADFADNTTANIVYVHTGKLDPSQQHLFTLAQAGYRYTIVAERNRPTPIERGLAHKALSQAFAGAFGDESGDSSADWLNAMLDAAVAISVNRGQIVVRHNGASKDLYVVLTGELEVLVDAEAGSPPRRVATIHAGEVFGEMAVINDAPRVATVRAQTPARLLRIPGELFGSFATEAKLVTTLPDIWRKRAALETVAVLGGASVTTRNLLARHAVHRMIEPGATLIREGSRSNTVFVLVAGRVQIYKGNDPLMVGGAPVIVDPGTLLGETAPFLKKMRNASIVAIDECEVLAIRGADFERIVRQSPHLFCCISQIVKQRSRAA